MERKIIVNANSNSFEAYTQLPLIVGDVNAYKIVFTAPYNLDGALESKAGWKGLLRKGATLMIVLVAVRMDVIIGTDFIRTMVIFAFMSNEAISILENTGLMGIPIPKVLTKAIDILQSRNESSSK